MIGEEMKDFEAKWELSPGGGGGALSILPFSNW